VAVGTVDPAAVLQISGERSAARVFEIDLSSRNLTNIDNLEARATHFSCTYISTLYLEVAALHHIDSLVGAIPQLKTAIVGNCSGHPEVNTDLMESVEVRMW
jgi:hypothetical protein